LAEALLWLLPAALFAGFALTTAPVANGGVYGVQWSWAPSLDANLSFYLDGLSLLFALLISGIGAVVFAYAPGYFGNHPDRGRLYVWLLLFLAAMLGLVLSDNVITVFVFWELTGITSYLLIGFKHEQPSARAAALQALLVTGLGGLCLLAGLLLLAEAGGSYELTTLLTRAETMSNHPLLTPSIVLILLGAFTKSAQFPFHFWLPAAMEAPTPVSAYLHSATMVKAGVYLVARLSPLFCGIAIWDYSIVAVGGATGLVGGWLAWQQSDLKRLLAYSTVSALGAMMLLLGLGTPLAAKAAIVLLLSHSLYKGALFLIAGAIDHGTGTRDVRRLGGLAKAMPLLTATALLAGMSLAGLPPAGGFLAKELVYESTLALASPWLVLSAVLLLISLSFVAVAGLVVVKPFLGTSTNPVTIVHPLSWRLVAPPLLLGILGLAIGMAPAQVGHFAIGPALEAVGYDASGMKLKLWHGFSPPLLLSGITLVLGVGLYAARRPLLAACRRFPRLDRIGPAAGYEFALLALKATAGWQSRLLQNGRLRIYLLVVLTAFVALVGYQLLDRTQFPPGGEWLDLQLHELFVPALILCAAWMVVRSSSRLAAVCGLGVIGYAVAMLFVMFGAPDLAMTQLAIETLTVILFVFVLYRLPRFANLSSRAARWRDAAVAALAGGVMTTVVLAATLGHAPSQVAQFFAENSLTAAKGRNMVNVILVDFRGLDTLGEITVLAVAALGIYALMRLRSNSVPPNETPAGEGKADSLPSHRLILDARAGEAAPALVGDGSTQTPREEQ
jgi:multicomponent Na+:H+ antiporter subunit A